MRRVSSNNSNARDDDGAAAEKEEPHPSLDIVSASGSELRGRRIILCITGSVAAYRAIELARLLMRHGSGDVTCVVSRAATKLIRPAYFKWATGNDVITDLTGDLEHVRLADYGRSDLVIVYPATANTLGRLANGMDDTPVSAVLTVAFGSGIPIVVCPAMHESMYGNPAVLRNMQFLREKGVEFVGPQMIEGKAKVSEPEQVAGHVIEKFGPGGGGGGQPSPLSGMRILLTAGPTAEHIDPVRIITNRSSGRTGVLLASEFLSAGAEVVMVYGPGREEPPKGAEVTRVETGAEMQDAVLSSLRGKRGFDVVVMAAAVSDYTPVVRSGTKIKSAAADEIAVRLRRAPKIINMVRGEMRQDALLVGFKAEANISRAALIRSARGVMAESGADMVIANDIGSRRYRESPDMNSVIAVTAEAAVESGWGRKEAVAGFIRKAIEKRVRDGGREAPS